MRVVELDGEFVPILRWTVLGVRSSPVYLLDEVIERRGPGSLVAQVVDDPTSMLVGDKAETRVETVGHHNCDTIYRGASIIAIFTLGKVLIM